VEHEVSIDEAAAAIAARASAGGSAADYSTMAADLAKNPAVLAALQVHPHAHTRARTLPGPPLRGSAPVLPGLLPFRAPPKTCVINGPARCG